MLISLALVFLCGMALGEVFRRLKLPSLLGMIFTGILLGPHVLDMLDPVIMDISADLRQTALIIILTRAGLSLDIEDLKRAGRPAMLMCFVPACLEIAGMLILGPALLGISLLESAVLGTVIAAVSPAVVVPRMLNIMEEGYGASKSIPQMVMAGASVDDVFVIVLFTAFTGLARGGNITPEQFLSIPVSIILGLVGGTAIGLALSHFFARVHIRDSGKVIIILSLAFMLVTIENSLAGIIGFSGLLAVMALGARLKQGKCEVAGRLSKKFSKLWVGAEILLFVLVGATVDTGYVLRAGIPSVALIFCVLLFRMAGVFLSLIRTPLNKKERIFSAFAYIPKATVQAAIGGLPLAMGLACGDIVLTVAVLSILITAPLGAALVDATYKKLLVK